jgi:GNAT superfamily N-acetyltransferase
MQARVEPYRDVLNELLPLYCMLWDEAGPPGISLAPRFEVYDVLDAAGQVVVVALRDGQDLVGYSLAFVTPALHAEQCLAAETDTIFVHPKVRGRHGGLRILRAMREELTRRGVEWWRAGVPLRAAGNGLGAMYRHVGFTPEQTSYGVRLK